MVVSTGVDVGVGVVVGVLGPGDHSGVTDVCESWGETVPGAGASLSFQLSTRPVVPGWIFFVSNGSMARARFNLVGGYNE